MRVATYSQPTAPTRGSLAALGILVLTILLGTSVLPTLVDYYVGSYEREVTYVWLLVYALSFLGLMLSQGINWISWLVRYRILLVVLMIGTIMSVGWSVDTKVSAERTIHLVGSTLVAIYIGFTVPLLTTLRVFAVVLGISIVASALVAIGITDLGVENYEGRQVWKGIFNSKNDLGFWAAIGVLLYVTLSDSTNSMSLRLLCYVMAGLSLAVLGLSHSATSLLAMLIAGSLSLYLYIANRFQLGFIRMAFMAVLFTALVGLAVANIDTAELVGRTDDLTGRGEVWRQTWKIIMDRPLTGYGYGAIWFPNDATIWIQQSLTDFTWIVFHAHNGFLQVASEVGLPLSVIALLMVAQQMIEIFYCQYERQQVGVLFVLAFVVAYLISNFSEARFLVTRELFWIFFLALPISMLRQINLQFSPDEAVDGDSGDGTGHGGFGSGGIHDKPWLNPQPGPFAGAQAGLAAAGAGSAYADRLMLPHQHADFADETFDSTSGTMSLTDADIDLGSEADITAIDEMGYDTGSIVDIEVDVVEELDEYELPPSSEERRVISDDLDDYDNEVIARYEPDTGDRYDKTMSADIDDHDDLLDESGVWEEVPPEDD